MAHTRRKVLAVFGTRPEVIKLAPVIRQLENRRELFATVCVASGQHAELLYPFVRLFDIRVDHDLRLMRAGQTPSTVCADVLAGLDPVLASEQPDLVLVQGDTSTALAGALAAFHRRIPVGHVEAGLRSGRVDSPFPEEMNRRLIARLASCHFAATRGNREALLAEGVAADRIFVTGNPVVDSLLWILARAAPGPGVSELLRATDGCRRVVLTTHRRESFGAVMIAHLEVLRGFVERHEDVALMFPVHPNPSVREAAERILGRHPRIHLLPPLNYDEFIVLLSHAWLVVSDSGGIQEEAPTLGKPLLILRDTTERPEALEAGVARLVGGRPARLAAALDEAYRGAPWIDRLADRDNPFGHGDAGLRIVDTLARVLDASPPLAAPRR